MGSWVVDTVGNTHNNIQADLVMLWFI